MPYAMLRHHALTIHAAGVAAADPAACLEAALPRDPSPAERVWIVAVGKAAGAMATAAAARLAALGRPPAGGLVVGTAPAPGPAGLRVAAGDHPQPAAGSLAAAEALAATCAGVGPGDEAWVLVSGGTSSLIAAPVEGVPVADFRALHRLLGAAGLPIADLNAVRKRFARWGAGRLLLALPAARVRVYCLSDVPGDDPADIGSGPCEPDPASAADIRSILRRAGIWEQAPASVRAVIDAVIAGTRPETPKPGDPAFGRRDTRVIGSNRTAVAAAAARARALGYDVRVGAQVLTGEAAAAGRAVATGLLAAAGTRSVAVLEGGETTVALGPDAGLGGRCQELALAAARVLRGAPVPAVVLAAGTDGRDGPTDAAGAVVDPGTWDAIAAGGGDPAAALDRHDAHPALGLADALVRTGPTGTNVMDLVVGLAAAAQSGGVPGGGR